MLKNKKICVIYGGLSAEREVSLNSGKNMFDALKNSDADVTLLDADHNIAEKLTYIKPDLCVIALHGTFGEDGCVQGLLEMMGIPYTGSGVAASAIAFDKIVSKLVFKAAGLTVPDFRILDGGETVPLCLPCVVKPARQGSSVGITIVDDAANYEKAVAEAFRHDSKVLEEKFINGKEITVPVMNGKVYPPIWIRPKKKFYDYECKYTKGMTEYLFETGLPPEMLAKISDAAAKAYNACGCRSMARVDFMVTDDTPYVIEVNTLPGMTATSLVPKSAAQVGISFEELIKTIAENAALDNA